jgi:peptidoglycan hydrolase-like protein with peptidoglycan-binding domain
MDRLLLDDDDELEVEVRRQVRAVRPTRAQTRKARRSTFEGRSKQRIPRIRHGRPRPSRRLIKARLRRPVFIRPNPARVCPSQGSEYIRWVQSRLNQLAGERLIVNGIINRATREAVRRFQQRQGLPADGIAGPDTQRALLDAGSTNPASDPNQPTTTASEFETLFEDGFEGSLLDEFEFEYEISRSSREYVKWIQVSLNKVLGTRLAVDGIIGPMTRSATRTFQQRSRLAVDGIVGPRTEAALIAAGASRPPGSATSPSTSPGPASAVNVELPLSGLGFYSYDRTSAVNGQPHQFGRRDTIDAIKAIGAAWHKEHPSGPRIGVGHISLKGGGDTPSHAGHETGLEVDLRPVRSDGAEAPVTIHDSKYSHDLTKQLVEIIRANRILPVSLILFNDTKISGVREEDNHHHHLHVRFG